ncbi:MAG: hypothetical protein IE933_03775 [Sphingomonadales bacterium]|nr:hypothetical protein [Sphingomonadales bacterium]MBD3774804.1 hypothetical protein [Paracoccaceae bacterium]
MIDSRRRALLYVPLLLAAVPVSAQDVDCSSPPESDLGDAADMAMCGPDERVRPVPVPQSAEPATTAGEPGQADAIDETPFAAAPSLTIPKLTPVTIEIVGELGSKLSKSGDRFPIRLAAPIIIDGVEVVPAGAQGEGEVIHAKKAGALGAGGELVLAARYVMVGGRQLKLRSFKWQEEGEAKDKVNTVNAIAVGSAAAVPLLAFAGFFIKGGQITIPPRTLAVAKTAEDFMPAAEVGMDAGETGSDAPPEAVPGDNDQND